MTLLQRMAARQHLPKTAVILLLVALFARLGVWQLDRLAQRRVANAALLTQLQSDPVDLNEADPDALTTLENRQATVTGEFDYDYQVAVVLQANDGRPGVHLVAPLVMTDGERAVLINRGWLPLDLAEPSAWPALDEPGEQVVTGAIQMTERLPRTARVEQSTLAPETTEVYRIEIGALDAVMPYELLPVYLLQGSGEANAADLPLRLEPDIDLSDGPHLSYAIQWFAFAAMAVGFYAYYLHRSADA